MGDRQVPATPARHEGEQVHVPMTPAKNRRLYRLRLEWDDPLRLDRDLDPLTDRKLLAGRCGRDHHLPVAETEEIIGVDAAIDYPLQNGREGDIAGIGPGVDPDVFATNRHGRRVRRPWRHLCERHLERGALEHAVLTSPDKTPLDHVA